MCFLVTVYNSISYFFKLYIAFSSHEGFSGVQRSAVEDPTLGLYSEVPLERDFTRPVPSCHRPWHMIQQHP